MQIDIMPYWHIDLIAAAKCWNRLKIAVTKVFLFLSISNGIYFAIYNNKLVPVHRRNKITGEKWK